MRPLRFALVLSLLAAPLAAAGDTVPVVVELFTSQGCSSCPPADALLRELDAQPIEGAELIVLSEHVDYWNGLGWKDPFSAKAFTSRQYRYGETLAGGRVYTPQMVVNGKAEFVGNRRQTAYDVIAAAARDALDPVPVLLQALPSDDGVALSIVLPDLASVEKAFDVVLAVTESGLGTDVRRGENAGRQLIHTGVVRLLETVGTVRPAADRYEKTRRIPLDADWNREGLRAVVFLQQQGQGRILGAATTSIVAHP